eukprot:1111935-Ditylum_brightwellii.AAC.1
MSKKDMIKFACDLIKDNFNKENDVITYSMSCDASKNVPLPQVNHMYKKVIGGAAPDHCLPFPQEDNHNGI